MLCGSQSVSVTAAAAAVPDFSLTECLKHGAFGKVSVAQTENGCKLVVKEIQKCLTRSKRRNEQKSLVLAPHTFVLHHLCYFEKGAVVETVFDYCPGGDLAQLVGAVALTEQSCQLYLTEITLALSHLHSHGIVHCDLKPSNVLFDSERHVQVADFSIVDSDVLADYGVKVAFGAPEFLAPEILKGTKVCRGADWYSVGALTCYMLSGKTPFNAEEGNEMLSHIFQGKLALDKSVSIKARNLITTTMRLEPAARLGASDGDGDDVRAHMFFAGADIQAIKHRQVSAPILPQPQDDEISSAASGQISVSSSVCTASSVGRRSKVGCAGPPVLAQTLPATPLRAPIWEGRASARCVNSSGMTGISSYMQSFLNMPFCGQPLGLPEEQVQAEVVDVAMA